MKAIALVILACLGCSYWMYTNEVQNEERQEKARVQWVIQKQLDTPRGYWAKAESGMVWVTK